MSQIPLVQIHNIDEVRLDSVDRPHAGSDDIVVEVKQCGICGSDLGFIAMGGLFGPGTPMALGHELSGKIVEAGNNVNSLAVGDRVVVNPVAHGNSIGNGGAEGGFSPFLLVRGAALDPQSALKIPDSLDDELGALIEPLAVAMHASHQANIKTNDKAVIFGAGPIGLSLLLVLQYQGLKNIVMIDLCEERLEKARKMGAIGIKADTGELDKTLIKQHGTAELMGSPVTASDVFFEATGAGAVFNQIANLTKPGARLVVVGLHKAPVELNLVNLLVRELTITGSMAYTNEFSEVIEMLACAKVDAKQLISHRFALSDFHQALATAQDTSQAIKVLIDCQS